MNVLKRLFSLVVVLVVVQGVCSGEAAVRCGNNMVAFVAPRHTKIRGFQPVVPAIESCPFSSSTLHMDLFESMSFFLKKREGDFMKLDKAEKEAFGPGPLLLLYKVPDGVTDEEIQDMLSDGAPVASQRGVIISRMSSSKDKIMTKSLSNALAFVLEASKDTSAETEPIEQGCPVLFFSGFRNDEMLATYNILGREIYQETGGASSPACAKAVPNAMEKPLSQVLEEISSDHMDAMSMNAETN